MERPSPSDLLKVWETGLGQPPVVRALLLLAAAHAQTDAKELAQLPVGSRDAKLLQLREALFGPTLQCLTRCPNCGELLDLEFPAERIGTVDVAGRAAADSVEQLDVDGFEVRFRLPNSSDLIRLQNSLAVDAEQQLLAQCVLEARSRDRDVDLEALPRGVMAAIGKRMAEADPQADVQLALSCPACGYAWQTAFDIVSHLWTEVEAYARRLLGEIHVLACAYGWREAEILEMTPARRDIYLDLCRNAGWKLT